MEPAIVARGGFVDSYIGDAIMALFEVAPASAVGAAVDMHRQLRPLNAQRVARGLRPIHIGVGLNTGELTLGTIGGPQRIKCGVIGVATNGQILHRAPDRLRYWRGPQAFDQQLPPAADHRADGMDQPDGGVAQHTAPVARVVGPLATVQTQCEVDGTA